METKQLTPPNKTLDTLKKLDDVTGTLMVVLAVLIVCAVAWELHAHKTYAYTAFWYFAYVIASARLLCGVALFFARRAERKRTIAAHARDERQAPASKVTL